MRRLSISAPLAIVLTVLACRDSNYAEMSRRAPNSRGNSTLTSQPVPPSIMGCGSSHGDNGDCEVTITPFANGSANYQVERPVVNRSRTSYAMITFQPGDWVFMRAGGCLQTGGSGGGIFGEGTWKRYVDPSGDDTPRLYHGTVTLEGVSPPAQVMSDTNHIKNWLDVPFQIPPASPGPVTLVLGYEDDDYDDNGYWSHDDGDDGQCGMENGVAAHVSISVNLGTAPPPPVQYPYDLVADAQDVNLIDLNPRWAWQVPNTATLTAPDYDADHITTMTSQNPTWDDGPTHLGTCPGTHGHHNWGEATYTGTLEWVTHDGGVRGDDDYNLFIHPPWVDRLPFVAGAMKDRADRILMEFDSDETVDQFESINGFQQDQPPHWWSEFHRAVDSGDGDAQAMIDGKFAIVTGLVGVDEVHNPNGGNEIHPVHVLAVRASTWEESGYLKERWGVFVRTWGNEGYCGTHQHFLNSDDRYVLRLPPAHPELVDVGGTTDSAPGANNLYSNMDYSNESAWISLSADRNDPAWIWTFHLGNTLSSFATYSVRPWMAGDVTVSWKLAPGMQGLAGLMLPASPSKTRTATASQSTLARRAASKPRAAAAALDPDVGGEADGTGPMIRALTPSQLEVAFETYSQLLPERPAIPLYRVQVAYSLPPVPPSQRPSTSTGPAFPQATARADALYSSVCISVDHQYPNSPGGCDQAAPATMLSTQGAVEGKNGWSVSPITATLTALDASGAGFDFTEYGYDSSRLVRYRGPFLVNEGGVALQYRSTDRSGNVEDMRLRTLRVDTQAPTAEATATLDGTGIALSYSVLDPLPGSGGAGIHTVVSGPSGPFEQFTQGGVGTVHLESACTALEYWGEDVAGNEQTPHARTPDVDPPLLDITPSLCMWPPNHQRVMLRLGRDFVATAHDGCDPAPTVRIVDVKSSESDVIGGSGHTVGDAAFGPNTVCLRRERSGTGSGRMYTVTVESSDASGNSSRKALLVIVPKNGGDGCGPIGTPIDEGAQCE